MSDHFATWTSSLANIRSAGITSPYLKAYGDGSYYYLGNTRDAKLTISNPTKADTLLRPYGWGALVECVLPIIQAGSTEIKLLDQIVIKLPLSVSFGLSDAVYFETNLLAPMWKLICDPNFDDFRIIELTLKGAVKTSELDALFTASRSTLTGGSSVDALYALGTAPVLADQVPNGLSKVEFKASGDSGYADFGDFTGGKYVFETIGVDGGGARMQPRVSAIKFTFDAVGHETDITKLQFLDSFRFQAIDLKLTHMDGVVLTMPNTNVQVSPTANISGNVDKMRDISLHAEGALFWSGTAFGTTGGTAWDSMWV